MKRSLLFYSTCLGFLFSSPSLIAAPDSLTAAEKAATELRNRDFKSALQSLSGDLKAMAAGDKNFTADALLLLRARAQSLSGKHAEAIATCKNLLENFPQSTWRAKATFLIAQAHTDMRNYKEAAAIYEAEAQTLFSPAYKDEVAKLLVKVAEDLSKNPQPGELDKPKPNYKKAALLLKEAYGVDCSLALKESILAERIHVNRLAQDWGETSSLAFLYLQQFDPQWQGPIGSLSRLTHRSKKNIELTGSQTFSIRYQLSEALHRSGQRLEASRYLTELIVLMKTNALPGRGLLADATWLRLMAQRANGGTPYILSTWVADAEQYLADFPTHIHASSTVYSIAVIYENAGKLDDAIQAYHDYADNKYKTTTQQDPLTARPETKQEHSARITSLHKKLIESSYKIGLLHLQNHQFEKAKQAWLDCSKKFPNGAHWADCQKGLVDIDFQKSIYAVANISRAGKPNEIETARTSAQKSLQSFIQSHPLDTRIPVALYLAGNIHFEHANSLDKPIKATSDAAKKSALKVTQDTAFKTTISSWETLISKYPKSPQANEALYLTALIYEDRIGDLEKALSIYKQGRHKDSRNRIVALTSENLIASSSQIFTTTEQPHIVLNSRNIEDVTVRLYWLDIESYFRKARKLEDITDLDIDLVEADKTWKVKLPNYRKHHLMESKLDIPFPAGTPGKPGICVIKVESEKYSTTTIAMRSNIDIAIRSNQ